MTRRALMPWLVLALLLGAWCPVTAGASTISGQAGGARVPAAGKGFAAVRAVNAKTLAIAAVGKLRSGRYTLKVPAGGYLLFGSTTPFRGKAGVDLSVGKVSVRAGKRKTQRVSLRKPKRKKAKIPKFKIPKFTLPGATAAQAGFVPVKYPAVWIQHFSVSGPADFGVLRKGLADMLITDVVATLGPACGGTVVEREHLADILAEQQLQQSPSFDPTTRVPTGHIIAHNREVTGKLTVTGANASLTATVTNVVTGTTRSVTRTGTADRVFELEQSIVQEVTRLICGDKPPVAYTGQASGETSGSSGSTSQKLSWSGNVRLRFTGDLLPENSGDPPGEYALYEPESGGIHLILDGTDGECSYHGEANVSIVPRPGEFSRVQQGVDDPAYALIASLPVGAAVPYTTTGPSYCGGGTTGSFAVGGRVILGTTTTQHSSSTTLVGSVSVPIGPVLTKWAWSLSPQAT